MTGIAIILFPSASGFDRAAQGVAGEGRRLADGSGGKLHAILTGKHDETAVRAVSLIADAVTLCDDPRLTDYQAEHYLESLTRVLRSQPAGIILLGNDSYSQELAPRLAHRLGGSAAGDGVEIRHDQDSVSVRRSVYGGKAEAIIHLKRSPAIVWVRARSLAAAPPRTECAKVSRAEGSLSQGDYPKLVERMVAATSEVRLEDARVIVSGGRGIGGPEPFRELEAVASLVGGQVGASRAACDAGWVPPSWQVGQTGKKVAPGLYLAVAIHGASQHLAGISDAKVIAAINIDRDAPIFRHCSFGIVEDYRKVIPLLRDRLATAD